MLQRDDQLHQDGKVHILIGMDVMSKGDTSITWREDGQLWFVFRQPLARERGERGRQ